MSLHIRFNLCRAIVFLILILLIPGIIIAQPATPAISTNPFDFVKENWALFALVLSEIMAFLPQKFSGIAQSLLTILNYIFKKK